MGGQTSKAFPEGGKTSKEARGSERPQMVALIGRRKNLDCCSEEEVQVLSHAYDSFIHDGQRKGWRGREAPRGWI